MLIKIFAIRDAKALAFGQPFFSQTKGTAIRSFQETVNDPNSPFHKYPDDYSLFEIGIFDDEKGTIEALDIPQVIGNALEFKTLIN